MANKDDISSTEKLLGVIRGERPMPGEGNAVDLQEPVALPGAGVAGVSSFRRLFMFQRPVQVGVVVGHRDITLAAVSPSAGDRRFRLLDFRNVPVAPEVKQDRKRFEAFLKKALGRFCAGYHHVDIWSTIPSARVEIRHVLIPKVPEKQVANAVYWTYKKQAPFDEREMIFDFELLGEVGAGGARRIQALAYSVPRAEVEDWKQRFMRAGYPLRGVSIVPFAVQNFFRTGVMQAKTENVCILYIGRDWSRIDIFGKGNLVLSRDIKTGMNSFIASIRSGLAPADEAGAAEPEGPSMTETQDEIDRQRQAERLFISLASADATEKLGDAYVPVMEMVSPVLDRLMRQVERTMGHFTLHFDNAAVDRFYLAGDLCGSNPLVAKMNEQCSHPVHHMDPFDCDLMDIGALQPPDHVREKDAFVPAIGIALSNASRTPNLAYTYRHKATRTRIQRINRIVFVAFFLVAASCLGYFFYQGHLLDRKQDRISRLEQQLAGYNPQVDKEMIQHMAGKVRARQNIMATHARRYFGMAVITELSQLMPSNIQLLRLELGLGDGAGSRKASKKHVVMLDGIVSGPATRRASDLTVFMLRLNSSPMFPNSTVVRKAERTYNGVEVLGFTVKLETL